MTHDDHQRERMRHWSRVYSKASEEGCTRAGEVADLGLNAFDKRFPAPSAAAPVEPDGQFFIPPAELATLRQKARLWDAVAIGKVSVEYYESGFYSSWADRNRGSGAMATAEEAVESAIAQGALK